MNKLLVFSIFILLFSTSSVSAQTKNDLYCLGGKKFDIPKISLMTGFSGNYKTNFDVKNFKPENVKISTLDSLNFWQEEFIKATRKNLELISFLKDTSNVELKIYYIIKSGRDISDDYAEVTPSNEIKFVFRKIERNNIDPSFYMNQDTITLIELIPIFEPLIIKPEILVERKFLSDRDTTIIIKNNFLEMNEDILARSKNYSKKSFLDNRKDSRYFFIKFVLYLSYPECDDFNYFYD